MGNKLGSGMTEEDFVFDEESLLILQELEAKLKIKIKRPHEKKIMLDLWMRSELDKKNPNTQKEYNETINKLQRNKCIKKRSTILDSKLDQEYRLTSLGLEEKYNFRCSNDEERKKIVDLYFKKVEIDDTDGSSKSEFNYFINKRKIK